MLQNKVPSLPRVDEIRNDVSGLIQRYVGLGDDVFVFFPCRQIVAMGFVLDCRLVFLGLRFVGLIHFGASEHVVDFISALAGVQDLDFIDYDATDHTPVGALDKAVVIDARKTGQGRNQTDVRAFGRFNRTDPAIVRRVNVAHFKTCALSRQASRSKSGKTPLVRNFRQRIGLIHELRKLAGAKEFADCRHHWLGVDQVMRHGRRHFLVHRHLFFDGAFHSDQTDAELVFEQFAHRANAAVAQVIDIVHRTQTAAQPQQVFNCVDEVFLIEGALIERRLVDLVVQLDVELHAADARKIVFARIEEHALE